MTELEYLIDVHRRETRLAGFLCDVIVALCIFFVLVMLP